MARGSAVVAEEIVETYDEFGNIDILAEVDGFRPITAYSIEQPRLKVVCDDNDDPELRTRIRFNGGVFLCTQPIHVETLKGKPGIYFEDMPAGVAADVCPKNGCRFAPRNTKALLAHIAKHID